MYLVHKGTLPSKSSLCCEVGGGMVNPFRCSCPVAAQIILTRITLTYTHLNKRVTRWLAVNICLWLVIYTYIISCHILLMLTHGASDGKLVCYYE